MLDLLGNNQLGIVGWLEKVQRSLSGQSFHFNPYNLKWERGKAKTILEPNSKVELKYFLKVNV